MLKALPEEDRDAIRGAVLAEGEKFVTQEGSAVFPASVVGVKARKPS